MIPRRTIAACAVLTMLLTACTGDAAPDPEPASVTTSAEQSTTTSTAVAETASPQADLDRAVSEAIAAGSYAFTGTVRLSVNGGATVTQLEGWVDGADRLLTVELGGQRQTTAVTDGIAVISRGDRTVEIPVRDAGEAPSLELLRAVEDVRRLGGAELTGIVPASVLSSAGFDATDAARVVVELTPDGALGGYQLFGSDLTWTVNVDFADFGAAFSG